MLQSLWQTATNCKAKIQRPCDLGLTKNQMCLPKGTHIKNFKSFCRWVCSLYECLFVQQANQHYKEICIGATHSW